MSEQEWRGLGVQQSQGWEHYMRWDPGKEVVDGWLYEIRWCWYQDTLLLHSCPKWELGCKRDIWFFGLLPITRGSLHVKAV